MNSDELTWKPKGWKRAVRVEIVEQRRQRTRVRVLEGRRKGWEPIVDNEELGLPVLPDPDLFEK